ncbi:hypothetical protein PLESTB_000788100 [Pleodorina starrii]|uniref:Uncharacterized protein n=1 Tax=Pleodorina starrii TaxID=330485 RepID=A0A9W6BL58_9CHLO|nr:hypothetical protein PLESTB_000788100 [Pleodorina starrii]
MWTGVWGGRHPPRGRGRGGGGGGGGGAAGGEAGREAGQVVRSALPGGSLTTLLAGGGPGVCVCVGWSARRPPESPRSDEAPRSHPQNRSRIRPAVACLPLPARAASRCPRE